ncbi:MAG: 5-methyltetrahydropteroyltriglutamate--homocysteine S-methyltransferase [Candidatus Eremiobacteraeota bacterium]|nr:5-methyltetrahydropteroyltriglutamate--homocysteine S-methyltransferase [Candidatus Eremiobacteraeota bacterium]
MALAHNLGFPRIGHGRELKRSLEQHWAGKADETALLETAYLLRKRNWELQRAAGLDLVPVGDFSLYDHVLDTAAMLGAVPTRYGWRGGGVDLATYFAMARGTQSQPAMEMTKWFDTNYHYIVPEFSERTTFALSSAKLVDETKEALAMGLRAKPVLVGPFTMWRLGKWRAGEGQGADGDGAAAGGHLAPLDLIDRMLPVYADMLARLRSLGIEWVQMDEPALVLDLSPQWVTAVRHAYSTLVAEGAPKLLLATYFAGVEDIASELAALPVAGVHLDLVRAPEQLTAFARDYPDDKVLSLGVIDGRNVWRADLAAAHKTLEPLAPLGERLWIAPSCSLLHCPIDLQQETALDPELKSWMAFAVQKLDEVVALKHSLGAHAESARAAFTQATAARQSRQTSSRIHDPAVEARERALSARDAQRLSAFSVRRTAQHERLRLPSFPTTTIGSFPQTPAIREARAKFKKSDIDAAEYRRRIQTEIAHAVERQEDIGLDVLVHGEAERNDMVEYFGEQLRGFAFTQHGWVQSYGSRYVKPPIIFGDVSRPRPMTVEWIAYAQSLTAKPMKGMLTGPVTILQWSFVRDDQPRSATALQIALAIRDEVGDLESAGIKAIQIDEPAIREGLPLKRAHWGEYLAWAVRAFRVASSGVRDETQIHTHMCYSEFNDIIASIAAMDADVITIESSRSDMEILEAFRDFKYPNEIGPGVYDIHSPRVPSADEMSALLEKAAAVLPADQLWVNPDCGLKTRRWEEVVPALTNMVIAAKRMRSKVPASAGT